MKHPDTPRQKGKGSIELIEEATNLLRQAPWETLCCYYVGSIPFVFSILYFWADMSGGTGADGRLAEASLWPALLFLWMKCWQSIFARRLKAQVTNAAPSPFSVARLGVVQGILQPWSCMVMPLALLLALPFGWCFGFFQNVTVLGDEDGDPRAVFRKARRQAGLWPGQNIAAIFFLLLLAAIVFVNLCAAAFFFPRLLKSLLGVETVFTRSNVYMINSTFWVSMAALTYLCIDPLLKAFYVLRCFYGESLESGADLLVEMREMRRTANRAAKMILLCVAACTALAVYPSRASAHGAGKPPLNSSTVSVNAQELDKSIERVIGGAEFSWRLPRKAVQKKDNDTPGFIRTALAVLTDWTARVAAWVKKFFTWLADQLLRDSGKEKPANKTGLPSAYVFAPLFALLAAALCIGGVMLWRLVRRRNTDRNAEAVPEVRPGPDITDDNITAEELPGDRWILLAKELFDKGEIRLGLRALYLACIAHLAEEKLLTIARFKSNRDYERELQRRAHSMPELTAAFSRAVAIFERIWYGMHTPRQDMVDIFMADYRRIVTGAGQR